MIKNLLFDLGGVIMDIKRENAVHALEQLGMADADDFLGNAKQKGPFLQLEEGKISAETFYSEIRSHMSDKSVTNGQIADAFFKFLTGIPSERLRQLEELRDRGFKIYMLSNTNALMWNGPIAKAFKQLGHDVSFYFDGIVTSFEAGVCKPSARIFEIVVEKYGIKPSETLFLDDAHINIEAAEKMGFNARLITRDDGFMSVINNVVG